VISSNGRSIWTIKEYVKLSLLYFVSIEVAVFAMWIEYWEEFFPYLKKNWKIYNHIWFDFFYCLSAWVSAKQYFFGAKLLVLLLDFIFNNTSHGFPYALCFCQRNTRTQCYIYNAIPVMVKKIGRKESLIEVLGKW
jgi:hypothetical protein